MKYRNVNLRIPQLEFNVQSDALRDWLPSKGNALFTIAFTLAVIASLLWAQSVGALNLGTTTAGASTSTIAYQGRLADSDGNPLTDTLNMSFRLYSAATGSAPLWTEQWTGSNGVQVSDGLFNVMLGSLDPIPQNIITENDTLFLGITVGTDDEMNPRVQLGSVPFAVQALTVPDASITAAKIADGAVQSSNLNLLSGTACQSGHANFTFPGGGYVHTDIPSLVLDLTLEKPSKVLVWIDGLGKFTNDSGETGVEVFVDGVFRLSSIFERGGNWWFNVNAQRILDLSAGNHVLQGGTYSSVAGTMTIHGAHSYQTCIYYLVLGEQ